MKLTTATATFHLTILGYQFPDAEGETYDANWLRIHIDVSGPAGDWSATDPALLTYEVAKLADWLEAQAAGTAKIPAISFLEPMLLFRIVEKSSVGEPALRVHFGGFVRPSWSAEGSAGQENLWLDFPLSQIDLAAAARELRVELKRYPQRAEQ